MMKKIAALGLTLGLLAGCSSSPPQSTPDQNDQQTTPPVACTLEWAPVCGADGVTYGNKCQLDATGVEMVSEGECE